MQEPEIQRPRLAQLPAIVKYQPDHHGTQEDNITDNTGPPENQPSQPYGQPSQPYGQPSQPYGQPQQYAQPYPPSPEVIPMQPAVIYPAPGYPPQTGYVPQQPYIPMNPIIKKQTYSSAMSYIGITRRTTAWISDTAPNVKPLAIVVAVFFLLFMYAFITVWYFFTLFLFGWFLFPFRLLRRGHRKQEALQKQQLATMQAMLIQQQQQHYPPR